MTPFPAPPALALKGAFERTRISEPIETIEALRLDSRSPPDIVLAFSRHGDRPDSGTDDTALRSALVPWAGDMARLFRLFPLTSFAVGFETPGHPSDGWSPEGTEEDADLDHTRLWAAQRALEAEIVRFLVHECGETGFERAIFMTGRGVYSSSLVIRPIPNNGAPIAAPIAKSPFEPARAWLDAMCGWLIGTVAVSFTFSGRQLSAHERLDLIRRTRPSSGEATG